MAAGAPFRAQPGRNELLIEAARTVDRCEVLGAALRDQPLTTAALAGRRWPTHFARGFAPKDAALRGFSLSLLSHTRTMSTRGTASRPASAPEAAGIGGTGGGGAWTPPTGATPAGPGRDPPAGEASPSGCAIRTRPPASSSGLRRPAAGEMVLYFIAKNPTISVDDLVDRVLEVTPRADGWTL